MQPFRQSLRLNPKADAETLAHVGLLIPFAPDSIISAEVKTEPMVSAEPKSESMATNSTRPQQLHSAVLDKHQPAQNPASSELVRHGSKPAAVANAVHDNDQSDGQRIQLKRTSDQSGGFADDATAQVNSLAKASATEQAAAVGRDAAGDSTMTESTRRAVPQATSMTADRQAVAGQEPTVTGRDAADGVIMTEATREADDNIVTQLGKRADQQDESILANRQAVAGVSGQQDVHTSDRSDQAAVATLDRLDTPYGLSSKRQKLDDSSTQLPSPAVATSMDVSHQEVHVADPEERGLLQHEEERQIQYAGEAHMPDNSAKPPADHSSPPVAAGTRSIATPSRVKVPKQQPNMPLT